VRNVAFMFLRVDPAGIP